MFGRADAAATHRDSEAAVKSGTCEASYNSLLMAAKGALGEGDNAKALALLKQAKVTLERCGEKQDTLAHALACNTP